MTLQIRLFGRLEVADAPAAGTIALRPRARRLLAYVLLQRTRRLDRQETAFRLWPDSPETRALSTLRRALSELKAGLPAGTGGPYVLATRTHLEWNRAADHWLDLAVYEQRLAEAGPAALQEAVALYRDDLLTDFDEPWVSGERERLHRLQFGALLQLARHHRANSEWAEAARLAQQARTLEPYVEAAHRELMHIHSEAGDRAAALTVYEQLRTLLDEELGVAPAEETATLHEALVRGARPAGRPARPAPPPPPLFGRDNERATLQQLWQESAAGQGRVAFVSGEAGAGKTHLVQDLAYRVAAAGGQSLTGFCYEFEQALPYQPIAEMLRAARPDLAQLAIPSGHRAALARLLPEFGGSPGSFSGQSGGALRLQLFEALLHVFNALARRRPLLLLFEDVHWAADSTLDWLTYSLPGLLRGAVLVVVTYRSHEVDSRHTLARLERRLRRQGVLVPLELTPLSLAAHRQLIAHLSQRDEDTVTWLADRLYEKSGGNPFFLHELVQGLQETGQIVNQTGGWAGPYLGATDAPLPLPDSLRAVIDDRLGRLSEQARLFARAAAVAGRVFDHALVRETGGWSEEQALRALEELLERGFLKPDQYPPSFAFAHHLVQESIYAGLTPPRRTYLHRQMADATRRLKPDDVEALMHHATAAGQAEQAVAYGQQAAERADRFHAYEEAVKYREQVLTLLDDGATIKRLAVMEALADGYRMLRQTLQAVTLYHECLRLVPGLGDSELNRRSSIRLYRKIIQVAAGMRGSARLSDLNAVHRIREQLLPQIRGTLQHLETQPPRADAVLLLKALAGDALVSRDEVDWSGALDYARRAVTMAEGLEDPALLTSVLTTLGSVYGARGMVLERVQVAERQRELIRQPASDPRTHGHALNAVGSAYLHAGNYHQAIEVLHEAVDYARHKRIVDLEGHALSLLIQANYRLDLWQEMQVVEARRDELLGQYPLERLRSPCFSIGLSGALRALLGDRDTARRLRRESQEIMEQRGGPEGHWGRSHHY